MLQGLALGGRLLFDGKSLLEEHAFRGEFGIDGRLQVQMAARCLGVRQTGLGNVRAYPDGGAAHVHIIYQGAVTAPFEHVAAVHHLHIQGVASRAGIGTVEALAALRQGAFERCSQGVERRALAIHPGHQVDAATVVCSRGAPLMGVPAAGFALVGIHRPDRMIELSQGFTHLAHQAFGYQAAGVAAPLAAMPAAPGCSFPANFFAAQNATAWSVI